MKKFESMLCLFETILGSFMLFSILVLLTISVASRYVFVKPITWTDELSTFLFVLMTYLGASYSISTQSELIVNTIYERFTSIQKQLDYFLHSIRALGALTLMYSGYKYLLAEFQLKILTPLCQIPCYYIAAMVPFLGLLLFIKSILKIIQLKTR